MTENTGKHAAVNGLEMYYEIHGEGEPLILVHGGGTQDAGWDGSGMSDARLAILPHDALRHLLFSSSGCRRHAVPGHARAIKITGRESQER